MNAFQSEIDALSPMSLVASFSNEAFDWNFLPGDVFDIFEISEEPSIKPLGGNTFLLTFKNSKDMDLVLSEEEIMLWDCRVSFSLWRSGIGTLPMAKGCLSFGDVRESRDIKGKGSGISAFQVCVENYDLIKVPQFIRIIDRGFRSLCEGESIDSKGDNGRTKIVALSGSDGAFVRDRRYLGGSCYGYGSGGGSDGCYLDGSGGDYDVCGFLQDGRRSFSPESFRLGKYSVNEE